MDGVTLEVSASDADTSSQPVERKIENVEDKLEDRYNKLKIIAVKLKKRVADQAQEISNLEQVKNRTLSIQKEFDTAQDEIERVKKLETCLQKDLKAAMDANIKLKEADFEKSNQIQSLTATNKILREKVERADKFEEELTIWKSRSTALDNELKGVKQNEKEALQDKRQTAMLSLEITDYEKKLHSAYELLENSKLEVQAQVSQNEQLQVTIKSLEEQIDSLQSLNMLNENLQLDVQRKAEKITFLQEEVAKVNEKFQEKKSEILHLQAEYETCKLNFSSESKALVERCSILQKTVTMLENKISALEENKRSRESQISNLKLELHQLDTEYRNYKVKAQAMLKSQKPTHLSLTPHQDHDELENLQKIVQDFHSEISLLKSDLQTVKLENENLTMEKTDLNLKLKQIKTELIEKEVRLSSESQKLRSDLRLKEVEVKKLFEETQVERDLISSTFKEQMEYLKKSYEAKIKSLKEQLEMCKIGIGDFNDNDDSSKPSPSSDSEFAVVESKDEVQGFRPIIRESPFGCNNSLERLQQPLVIDTSNSGISFDQLRMMPVRGECEGSESASSVYLPRADNYNVSFEQLLNSSFDSVSKVSSDSDTAAQKPPPDLTSTMIKGELVRSQNQVRHLTALLRDSESNCERLTQLSEALKEEIRRVERDQERKEHLQENSEYLKNVLLKFITLSGEDERIRLIPVFKTMLKLAPEEVTRLEAAVKGGDNHDVREGNAKGWSSYLQKWTT